jgi:uncharacterized repeat protein (TIGR03803 family)
VKFLRILVAVGVLALAGGASGQTLTILYQFSGPDGSTPFAGLVQGIDGNFYGTTVDGGTNGQGTVFKITSQGTLTTLWQFTGGNTPTNGIQPRARLVQGVDGNFYGTTYAGGTNSGGLGVGCGTVFRMTPAGTLTTLWQFGGGPTNGSNPQAELVLGSDGNFYGTTTDGGTNADGEGTVFTITSEGTLTTIWQFGSTIAGGLHPVSSLVQGGDGNFYGTTTGGGTVSAGAAGGGTVFQITPEGTLTTIGDFGTVTVNSGGYIPWTGLVRGADGNFYGTASTGGTNSEAGIVFKIISQGTLSTLWQFGYNPNDGISPYGGLIQGSDGNFYGTTIYGGTNNQGTVFQITPQGTLTTLWQFGSGPSDGRLPRAGLVQGTDGNFYGTTEAGGTNNDGTVYKLSVPLNPPANQIAGLQFFDVFESTYAAFLIPSVAGETYQLQYTDSLNPTNWIDSGDPITSIGGPLTTFDLVEPLTPQRFYRFAIRP